MAKQPQVTWAQRESFLFITIVVDDSKIDDLTADANKLHFAGSSNLEKYETTLNFFDEIDGDSVKRNVSNTRVIELTVEKKEPKWWPRLLKEKKVHWLKVDFGKWKDEDDEEAEEAAGAAGLGNGFDLNQYMSTLGGAGGGADFSGLGDLEDEMPELEDNEEDEEDGGGAVVINGAKEATTA